MATKQKPASFIVGIGASAGGLAVLKEFVRALPEKSGMAYVIVQHLDPTHESMLSELLAKETSLPVKEAKHKSKIAADHVYVIAPGTYLEIKNGYLLLLKPEHARGMRKAVDHLFRSLANECKEYCAGILFSGSGNDGTAGLRAIKAAGGLTLAQEPATAEHPSMPNSAVAAGIVDKVLEIKKMPEVLRYYMKHVKENKDAKLSSNEGGAKDYSPVPEDLHDLTALLEMQENFNLRQYKPSTVQRRITRRMGLTGIDVYEDYLATLRENGDERKQLTRDLLINVTDFFRDKDAFDVLQEKALTELIGTLHKGEELRVWVAGCATGEEAYSLAMMLLDITKKHRKDVIIRIFATDIDEEAIKLARKGSYPLSIASEVPKHYLENYFHEVNDDCYRIKQFVRDVISFATQNVASDPPFSRMHLISCRNLLIYLKKDVQEKILRSFYFALDDTGYLLLGSSETIGKQDELFKVLSKKWRIFQKIPGKDEHRHILKHLSHIPKSGYQSLTPRKKASISRVDALYRGVSNTFLPPTVVVGKDGNIIYKFNDLSPFLVIPSGEMKNDFLQMVPSSMRAKMRSTLFKVQKTKESIRFISPVKARSHEEGKKTYQVTVAPILEKDFPDEDVLGICFEYIDEADFHEAPAQSKEESDLIQRLENELAEAKEDLQNTIEELETSTEELKASHEETLSTNEELQSSNEELEASSEELRSLNEELSTVNAQLKEKIDELQRANDDVENLIASTDIATIFLDSDLKIQRYTPAAEQLLKMGPRDIDRSIVSLGRELVDEALPEECRQVLRDFKPIRREVQDFKGQWYIRQVTPYRTEDRRIEGVVIVLQDINEIKQLSERATNREQQQAVVARLGLQALGDMQPEALMHQAVRQVAHVLDADYCKILKYRPEQDDFLLIAGNGWQDGLVGKATVPAHMNSQAGFTMNAAEPVIVKNLCTEKRFQGPELLLEHHVVSGMSCLINHTEPPYGVLGVHSKKERVFTEDDTHFLVAVANLLSTVIRNADSEEKIRLSEERFSIARDAADLGIHDYDPVAQTVKWDKRIYDIWGVPEGTPVTFDIFLQGVHPDDREHAVKAIEEALDPKGTQAIKLQYRVINLQTKQLYWIEATGKVFFEGDKAVRLVGTVRDMTAERQTQQELVEEREKAEQANRAKSEFLAMMSHEIRTPMNAVIGIANLLKSAKQLPEAKRDELHNTLYSSANALLSLINDILDISKIDAGTLKLDIHPFNFDDLLSEVADLVGSKLKKSVQFLCDYEKVTGQSYLGDKHRIRQIILNLATNAAKFTKEGYIKVEIVPEENSVEIRVEDTGIGIDPKHHQAIFDKFTQTDVGSAREFEGTGLGLAIVKSLVQAMRGEIRLQSELNEGATFSVKLPLIKTDISQEILDDCFASVEGHGKALLLVEDHEPNILVAQTMLKELGYAVTVKRNGREGIEEIEKNRDEYTGVFLDIRMPGMDGYQVMERVRKDEKEKNLPPLPIIAVTANALAGDKDKCIQAGATDYLPKPFDPSDLRKILYKYCA